jgi:hypothetical protein
MEQNRSVGALTQTDCENFDGMKTVAGQDIIINT